MATRKIVVQAAPSQNDLRVFGATVETSHDTIREAKERARHYTSPEYARYVESDPLGYACVMVDGECVFDIERTTTVRDWAEKSSDS